MRRLRDHVIAELDDWIVRSPSLDTARLVDIVADSIHDEYANLAPPGLDQWVPTAPGEAKHLGTIVAEQLWEEET